MNIPFISIEGPIGVGKTSLARAISKTFGFNLLQEIVEENPFLDRFYDNIDEWSFQTEMFFLCNRYKQLRDIKSKYLLHGKPVVSDYHIFKNTIFAQRTLPETERKKYIQIYELLIQDMPTPNLIVYLNASLKTLLQRIQLRGREVEKNIDHHYLQQLSDDYTHFMHEFKLAHPEITVLEFSGDELDFVTSQNDLLYIVEKVAAMIKKENLNEFIKNV